MIPTPANPSRCPHPGSSRLDQPARPIGAAPAPARARSRRRAPGSALWAGLALVLAGCPTPAPPASAPEAAAAAPAAPSPYGYAPSPLTGWADRLTAELMHVAEGGEARFSQPVVSPGTTLSREPGVTVPQEGELTGFHWEVLVQTEAQQEGDGVVMHLALTGDGLFLQNIQPASFLMPAQDQGLPELVEVLESMRKTVVSGQLSKVGMSLEQCQALMGTRCLIDAVYTPVLPLSHRYDEQLAAPIDRVFVLRAGTVHKQPDGRMADVQIRFVPHDDGVALAGDPLVMASNHGFHAPPPVLPPPTVDSGSIQSEQAWAYFCELDWQRTPDPPLAASRRCITHLDTVGLEGAREASHSTAQLEQLRAHIAAACAGEDAPEQCGKAEAAVLAAEERKRSLVDGETKLEPLLAAALAGKPLARESLDGLSDLSLHKLEAAIWLRHRFQLVDPDLRDFFFGPHDNSELLPLDEPSGELDWPMSRIDKANLDLVHR